MTDPQSLVDQLAAMKADNARLRRLLDEAGAPDSLRHGIRDTISLLRSLLRRSAETAVDVEGYVAHLDGRLDAIARIRTTTDALGEADLHELISDELLFHLVREGERATIDGPAVRLRPKPAQAMALAMHELASNAVEHGPLAKPHGRVAVTWGLEADAGGGDAAATVRLVWKETGGGSAGQPRRQGFGTVVLVEMLGYEMKARTTLAFEPDGLRCTVSFPLSARIGHRLDGDK